MTVLSRSLVHGLLLVAIALVSATAPGLVAAQGGAPDLTRLPMGDGRAVTQPTLGGVWRCGSGGPITQAGAFRQGPWINADGTFDLTAKLVVDGAVEWPSELSIERGETTRRVSGNGLPSHPTGQYPVSPSDDAYQYDRNPNSIRTQAVSALLPARPTVAAEASCLTPGAIGMLLTGGVVFDALDAGRRDAVAHEIQDFCGGHPERTGTYHYHSLAGCIDDPDNGEHSPLVGYAMDGFGLYGRHGEGGATLRNEDLDVCHGHTHTIVWDGEAVEMYHYHATWEFPYTLGCFRGQVQRGRGAVSP